MLCPNLIEKCIETVKKCLKTIKKCLKNSQKCLKTSHIDQSLAEFPTEIAQISIYEFYTFKEDNYERENPNYVGESC